MRLSKRWKKSNIIFKSTARASNSSTGGVSKSTVTTVASVYGAYYEGGSAESLIGAQFKANITGVVVVDGRDITVSLSDNYTIVIGSKTLSIVHIDNILLKNELIVIGVKEVV